MRETRLHVAARFYQRVLQVIRLLLDYYERQFPTPRS
jgi:hypothetical protein